MWNSFVLSPFLTLLLLVRVMTAIDKIETHNVTLHQIYYFHAAG